jgi:hypothetical protein
LLILVRQVVPAFLVLRQRFWLSFCVLRTRPVCVCSFNLKRKSTLLNRSKSSVLPLYNLTLANILGNRTRWQRKPITCQKPAVVFLWTDKPLRLLHGTEAALVQRRKLGISSNTGQEQRQRRVRAVPYSLSTSPGTTRALHCK